MRAKINFFIVCPYDTEFAKRIAAIEEEKEKEEKEKEKKEKGKNDDKK